MTRGLSTSGYLWSILSLIASVCLCVSYYLPYWLSGKTLAKSGNFSTEKTYHFGCFGMCIYYEADNGQQIIYSNCGRFENFLDIPSIWWRVCTVTVGLGCAISAVVAMVTVPAWCVEGLLSTRIGRTLGLCQAFSGILISIGCILYPVGWNNNFVIEACGKSAGPYLFGNCYIGWAFYAMLGGVCLLFFCTSLAPKSGKDI